MGSAGVASWRVLRWCLVGIHLAYSDQVWIDGPVPGHEDLDAETCVVEHENHVVTGRKFLDELEGGGEAVGIERDPSEMVLEDVKTNLGLDGLYRVPGFDYEEVAEYAGIECLAAEVINPVLNELLDFWLIEYLG